MKKKDTYRIIREEVMKAAAQESAKQSFNLYGRGHEPRITLGVSMAAVLRGCDIPRITISGFGPNNFYPKRVFTTAQATLSDRMGKSPFIISSESSIYLLAEVAVPS